MSNNNELNKQTSRDLFIIGTPSTILIGLGLFFIYGQDEPNLKVALIIAGLAVIYDIFAAYYRKYICQIEQVKQITKFNFVFSLIFAGFILYKYFFVTHHQTCYNRRAKRCCARLSVRLGFV